MDSIHRPLRKVNNRRLTDLSPVLEIRQMVAPNGQLAQSPSEPMINMSDEDKVTDNKRRFFQSMASLGKTIVRSVSDDDSKLTGSIKIDMILRYYTFVKLHSLLFNDPTFINAYDLIMRDYNVPPPAEFHVKGFERFLTKMINEYQGDVSKIKDSIRSRVVVSKSQLNRLRGELRRVYHNQNKPATPMTLTRTLSLKDESDESISMKNNLDVSVQFISANLDPGYINTHWVLKGLTLDIKFEVQYVHDEPDDHIWYEISRMKELANDDGLPWMRLEISSMLMKFIERSEGAHLFMKLEELMRSISKDEFNKLLRSFHYDLRHIVSNPKETDYG